MSVASTAELKKSSDPKKWPPIPILAEPKKFHSILDTEGVLKNVGGKKSVGRTLFFFDM